MFSGNAVAMEVAKRRRRSFEKLLEKSMAFVEREVRGKCRQCEERRRGRGERDSLKLMWSFFFLFNCFCFGIFGWLSFCLFIYLFLMGKKWGLHVPLCSDVCLAWSLSFRQRAATCFCSTTQALCLCLRSFRVGF